MKKITLKEQRIVSEILTAFMFTKNMDEVIKVWREIYSLYDLYDDPFTNTLVLLMTIIKLKLNMKDN